MPTWRPGSANIAASRPTIPSFAAGFGLWATDTQLRYGVPILQDIYGNTGSSLVGMALASAQGEAASRYAAYGARADAVANRAVLDLATNGLAPLGTPVAAYRVAINGEHSAENYITLGGAALGGVGGIAGKLFKVGAKGAGAADNAFNHGFQYADRVRARGLQDPVSHNFPYSLDDTILATTPIPKANGYSIYRTSGTMGKRQGIFEIGVTKDGIIDHRFFRPDK